MRAKVEIWAVAIAATVTIYVFMFSHYADNNPLYPVLGYLFWFALYIAYKLRLKYKK